MEIIKVEPSTVIDGLLLDISPRRDFIASMYADPNIIKEFTTRYGVKNNQFIYIPQSTDRYQFPEDKYIIFDIDLTPKYYKYRDRTADIDRIIYRTESDYNINPPEDVKLKAEKLKADFGEIYRTPYCISKESKHRVPKCISNDQRGLYQLIFTTCIYTEEYMYEYLYSLYTSFLRYNGEMFFVLPKGYFRKVVPITQKYFITRFLYEFLDYDCSYSDFIELLNDDEFSSGNIKMVTLDNNYVGFYLRKV